MKILVLLPLALLVACGDGATAPEPDPVSIATTSLPDGMVGASYDVVLAASGGTGSYGWSMSGGSLPAGLTLSAGGGITGTPGAAGASSFTVRATSGNLSGTRALSINIQSPEVVIATITLTDGATGTAYSQTLAASGGTGTFTWTVVGGALPAGLSLSAAGVIAGTPTTGGTSTFTVQAASGGRSATRSLSITVAFPAVSVTTTTLPDGTVGAAYAQTLTASGGMGTYTWALSSGTLPVGLTLYASGAITGTPTASGTSSFTVQATSGTMSAARALSITVQPPPFTITTTTLPDGAVGQAYSQALTADGALGTITWSLASGGLPPGVTLSAGGVLGGTPTTAGSYTFSVRATSGTQNAVQSLTLVVLPPPVTITTATLKPAVQGVPYSDTLRATGGTGSYTWSRTAGSLPAGLTLSGGGVISGTPTAQGSSTFTVQATSGPRSATKDLTLTVQPPALTITTTTLPGGAVGDTYSAALAASGGTGTYTWTRTAGTLPTGLTLSAAGLIGGTPQAVGTFTFTVQATSGAQTATRSLSITVSAALPPLTIATTALPGGYVDEPYSENLAASGGTGSYTWTQTSGTLPGGLTLSAAGGIAGTPQATGTFDFTVQVASGSKTASKPFSIVIGAALPDVAITTTSPLPDGTVGTAYSKQLSATGGDGSTYDWSVVSGLGGSGLSLSSAGLVSGTPTAAGAVTFTVRVTSYSKTTTKQFTITVAPGAVNITTTSLTDGTVNVPYSRTLQATGGAGPGTFTWSISGGALPAWLSLNPANGVLSGTPPAEGTFNFTVRATSSGLFDDQPLTLTVAYPPVVITSSSPLPGGTAGTAYSQTLTATGGSGTFAWTTTAGNLPGGLTLSSAGAITGTPDAAGTFDFTVRAASGSQNATKALRIVIAPVGGYAMYLNVGDNPTQSVNRGAQISIPLNVDLTQQGTQNLASITVRVDWDNTKFDFVNAPAGNWVDIDGSPASVTINTSTAASGYVTMSGYVADPDLTLTTFVLRTINLTAKAGAPTGTTPVTASVSAALNKDGQPVNVTERNLTVTIN